MGSYVFSKMGSCGSHVSIAVLKEGLSSMIVNLQCQSREKVVRGGEIRCQCHVSWFKERETDYRWRGEKKGFPNS